MRRLFLIVCLLLCAAAPACAAPAAPAKAPAQCHDFRDSADRMHTVCIEEATFFADVCAAIATFAWANRLPQGYLARVIWQESRFDPNAVSGAGAEGIAQFMPTTAELRGLRNSFQPAQALAYSAEYLRTLTDKFGNLGLAAAAYNAGEGRVSRWLASDTGALPGETRRYVEIVTGVDVDTWRNWVPPRVDYTLDRKRPFNDACVRMAEASPMKVLTAVTGTWKPWGVLLAQNFSRTTAIARFERASKTYAAILGDEELLLLSVRNPHFGPRKRTSAMVGRETRAEAEKLCAALRRAGASCVVVKN